MFKKNEGNVDRALRVIVGLALIVWFFIAPADAGYRWFLLIGIVPVLTGLIGWCPLYAILGVSTCPMKNKA